MAEYQGMKWHRCDFQVQTPEDSRHWADAETKLGAPRIEDDIQAKARTYLRRCHEVGLNVIGVTDHNFSARANHREWFLTHLIEQNDSVAEEFGRPPLTIFPGFEADIGYHVLCLFEQVKKGANLVAVNDLVTSLGLPPNQRFDGGLPTQLRNENALVPLRTVLNKVQDTSGGIVIAAHAFSDKGMCSNPMHMGDYALPSLMCVEVADFPLKGKAKVVLDGTNPDWKRDGRPPAYVRSSDAKSLAVDEDKKPVANSIGYRYSWLKMSEPSIEALRQAFVNSESRINLYDACPSDGETHPRIVKLVIKGAAFLEDQEVHFSPNLNCVIGGRGSGKSSILEYLRFCLEPEANGSLHDDIKEKHEVIRSTLQGANVELQVTFEASLGVRDTVVMKPAERRRFIAGRDVVDLSTVLGQLQAQFFSQGELTRLAKPGQNHVLRLVDASVGEKLPALARTDQSIRAELEQLGAASSRARTVAGEVQKLTQEVQELDRQWKARNDIQGAAQAQQAASETASFAEKLKSDAEQDLSWLGAFTGELTVRFTKLPPESGAWPGREFLEEAGQKIDLARAELIKTIEQAAASFKQVIDSTFAEDSAWPTLKAELGQAETKFSAACLEKGLSAADVSRLQEVARAKESKQAEVDGKTQQLNDLNAQAAGWADKLAELHAVWRQQFDARSLAASQIQKSAKATNIVVAYMRDRESFDMAWRRLNPNDNRKRLGKNWDDIGDALFKAHGEQSSVPSPWELIEQWRASPDGFLEAPPTVSAHFAELNAHLEADSVRRVWEQVRLSRVADFVDVELFRPDGQSAGSMSGAGGRSLSEGQRNTALLSLLLAQGSGPIIIDQPEDELDANYIFSDLVPFIRNVKGQRQLIIATHNANLPVNGDAELIYAIEARDGGHVRAQGGLDRPEVTRAVVDVMEGSEEAFKRRSEKYHFGS